MIFLGLPSYLRARPMFLLTATATPTICGIIVLFVPEVAAQGPARPVPLAIILRMVIVRLVTTDAVLKAGRHSQDVRSVLRTR